jgi:pilus assembly protein CpaE
MTSRDLTKPKERIRVLIIPGADPVGDWMANLISSEQDMQFVGLVRDLTLAAEAIEKLSPDVILVDLSSGILQRGDLINRLATPVLGAAIIIVALMGEVDMVRQAMLYGAQGFLLKPFSEAELYSSLRQAYDLVVQRRNELADMPRLLPGPAAQPPSQAEIVTVFSPKGGVGCTTIAINLAVALKTITNKKVILVDGDLRFGDIDTALNIPSTTSIGTVLPKLEQLDNLLLDHALVAHSSGIKVLTAPPYLDIADTIHPEELKRLMLRLAELGDGYVVVDAWSTLDDCTLSVLDVCHYLLLVTTPQVTALRDAHRFLEVLKLLHYDSKKIMLVLNHCYQRSSLQLRDVERALGHPVSQTIEYAPSQVTASLNRGVPLIQEYQDSPAARNILNLARLIAASHTSAEGREPFARKADAKAAKNENSKRRGHPFRGQPAAGKVNS